MIFNFRVFKDYASKSLSSVELKFLFRTFFRAALYFFGFGFLVFSVGSIVINSSATSVPVVLFLTLLTIPSVIALFFMFWKYRTNPLAVSSFFVKAIYTVLIFSFLGIFLVALSTLSVITGSLSIASFGIVVLLIFGATGLIYLIPAGLGLHIRSKGTILGLSKFIGYCYLIYIALFLVSLLVGIFGLGMSKFIEWFMFLLISVIIFASPVVTLYRLKTLVPYIDHENPSEVKKWEYYFAFEIFFQLLQMALHLIRIVSLFLSSRSISKS